MKKLLLSALLLLPFTITSQVQTRTYYGDEKLVPREQLVDFKHLKLEVQFEPENGKVIGDVTHSFTPLRRTVDSLYLDGPRIKIESIELNGVTVKHKIKSRGIEVYFDPPLSWETNHSLQIKYTALPKKGIYFIGWDDPTGRSRKQIWTQGQGIDNRHWIPMYDSPNDKVTTEVIVSVDKAFKVLSNGRKLSEKGNKNGTKTWHYVMKKPHAPYLIMLGIGEYEIKESKSKSGVPMSFWYYPGWEDRVEPTYRYSEDMMNFMEESTGVPYPWDAYAQIPVQDFMYGAMENTTATIYGDFYCTDERGFDDRNYVRVNAHELAHQWFGNMISARTSSHSWLQESFATHFDLTYQGIAFGKDHFDWQRRQAQIQAINASKKDLKPIAHSSAGSVRHYPKGSHVLQMLKYVIGEEEFNKTIQYFLQKHAYGIVDSEDLLVAFHEKLGLSLDWFWEEWIYKGGEPAYEVAFSEVMKSDKRIGVFEVSQVHERNDLVGLFDMPFVFQIILEDGSIISKRIRINEVHHRVEIPIAANGDVSFVLFDPNNEVMKSVDFKKSISQLLSQAENAEHMLDRYDAVMELGKLSVLSSDKKELALKIYEKLLKEEQFYAVKEAIVAQIANQFEFMNLLELAAADSDKKVKEAMLNYNALITPELLPSYEKYLNDKSYDIVESSLRKLCKKYPNNVEKYLDLTKDDDGIFGLNIKIARLEIEYLSKDCDSCIKTLVDLCSPAYEFRTRVNAANALKRLNYLNDKAIENLTQGTFSFNRRLRGPMYTVLDYFFEQEVYKKKIYDYVLSGNFNSYEKKRLQRYFRY